MNQEGNLWVINSKDSNNNSHLQKDSKIQLLFIDKSNGEHLTVNVKAYVYVDRRTIDEKWSALVGVCFEDGREDPNVSIICIKLQNVLF